MDGFIKEDEMIRKHNHREAPIAIKASNTLSIQTQVVTLGYNLVIRYNSYKTIEQVCLSPIFLKIAASSCCKTQNQGKLHQT